MKLNFVVLAFFKFLSVFITMNLTSSLGAIFSMLVFHLRVKDMQKKKKKKKEKKPNNILRGTWIKLERREREGGGGGERERERERERMTYKHTYREKCCCCSSFVVVTIH